jgi:transcriptional regulator GlxA family with amidase domain
MPTRRPALIVLVAALLAEAGGARVAAQPPAGPLAPPKTGKIRVAFLVSAGSNVIDMAGPWEVFQDVHLDGGGRSMSERMPFELFTVAVTRDPVRLTGGLHVIPDHALRDAPRPHVVVVPAMRATPEVHAWLRRVAAEGDVVISVCTGAFQLARAGLLDGRRATTHHDFWDDFAREFPGVTLVRGERWVESSPRIATAGGLTSGIDLALRVVERYFGREVAKATAAYMEHRSPYLEGASNRPAAP